MRTVVLRVFPLLALLLVWARDVPADELRLKDGEVLHGAVEARKKGTVHLRTGRGLRKVRVRDIAEHIEGEAPAAVIARKEAAGVRDVAALAALTAYAWQHDCPAETRRLAGVLLELEPDHALAKALLDERLGATTGPRWGRARKQALAKGGGTQATEAAVTRGLDWLAAHQDEDGKLDADGFQRHDPPDDPVDGQGGGHHGERVPCPYDGVTTATALMAWLAAGSTPTSGPYQDNVARALRYCVDVVKGGPRGRYGMWNHGFCTQAVADAYGVTRDPALRPVLEAAVAGILRQQLDDGGWSYYMPIGDVPTTGVAAGALGRAAQVGVRVDDERIDRLMGFLDARVDPKSGRSEYHDGAERKGYTPTRANAAAALTVRAWLGRLRQAPHLRKQTAAINQKPVWKISFKEVKTKDGRTVRAQIGTLYPYQWYYATTALFEHGGGGWTKWYGGLKKALLSGQRKDGAAKGSWDPLGNYSDSAGRVFVTAICVLMLQAPYRYPRGS